MIKPLTSFRFLAAFMVYIWHSVNFLHVYKFGYVGVSFFFVLSGFIMAYNYYAKFSNLNKEHIKKFYIARLAKIYPVHILTLTLSLPYMLIKYYVLNKPIPSLFELFTGMLANIFMVHSFIPLPFGTVPYLFNQVSWSLSTECFFYVIFPFLVFILIKLKFNKSIKKITLVTLTIYFMVVWLTFVSTKFREVKTDDWYYYVFPLFRSFDFIIGILVGLIFVTLNKQCIILSQFVFSILEVVSIGLFIVWIYFSPLVPMEFGFSVYYIPMWCFLIFIFAFQKGIISKLLTNKLLVFLGEISFSFYMIHLLIINYVGLLRLPFLLHHLITFFGSIIVSILIYKYYEEPLRKRIRFSAKKEDKVRIEGSA